MSIYGESGSYAETYAAENNIPFVAVIMGPTEAVIESVTTAAYNKLTIIWNQVKSADGYALYRSTDPNQNYRLIKFVEGNENINYTNKVTSGVTYYYKVCTYKANASGDKSLGELSESVKGCALPAAPEMKKVYMKAYNKIGIEWTKVNGCGGYVIYRSESADGKYAVLKTVTQATATEYTNIVRDGKEYFYKIRAFVLVNGKKVYGEYSNILSGNVISGPPSGFKAEALGNSKTRFSWDEVADADGYVIYMSTEADGTYKAVKNITSREVLTYTMKGNEKRYFRMKAYRNVEGKKVYSTETEVIQAK